MKYFSECSLERVHAEISDYICVQYRASDFNRAADPRTHHYLLDFMMSSICGTKVDEKEYEDVFVIPDLYKPCTSCYSGNIKNYMPLKHHQHMNLFNKVLYETKMSKLKIC